VCIFGAEVTLISFGLASSGLIILCAVCVVATVFSGLRTGIALSALSTLLFAVAGIAVHGEWINPVHPIDVYGRSPEPWIIHGAVFIFVIFALITAVHSIQKKLVDSLRDLSSRTGAQLEREEKFRLLAENMNDALFTNDLDLNITYVNSMGLRMLGYPLEEITALHTRDVLTAQSFLKIMTGFKEGVALAMQGGEVKIPLVDLEYVRKDKSTLWGELHVAFLHDALGRISGFQGIVRDVTERKKAEEAIILAREAAEKASQAKSDFITMMSHELRTPLTSILGFSELLYERRNGGLALEERNLCERISRNSRHLLNLINNILDIASIESGKMEIIPQEIDLRTLIGEAVAMMSSLAGRKPVEIRTEFPADVPSVETDGVKLMQVLINILGNSIKFTEKGRISVAARRKAGDPAQVEVSVTDTGIGIPPDKLNKIFEKFEQAEDVLTRKFGGAGLGLSVSRALMEMLGGNISVASKVGSGSTFTLTLPAKWRERPQSSLVPAAVVN
jgi:PAS domain S-box-containing protein